MMLSLLKESDSHYFIFTLLFIDISGINAEFFFSNSSATFSTSDFASLLFFF